MTVDVGIGRAPREELEALQVERLRATVDRTLAAPTPLRERLRGLASGADIASLGDLRLLPFTTKDDPREHYPTGLFAVPRERIVRLHASSGTGGKADRGRLHGRRPRDVGRGRRPLHGSRRGASRHGCPQRQRIPAVHRRHGFDAGTERLDAIVVPVPNGRTQR